MTSIPTISVRISRTDQTGHKGTLAIGDWAVPCVVGTGGLVAGLGEARRRSQDADRRLSVALWPVQAHPRAALPRERELSVRPPFGRHDLGRGRPRLQQAGVRRRRGSPGRAARATTRPRSVQRHRADRLQRRRRRGRPRQRAVRSRRASGHERHRRLHRASARRSARAGAPAQARHGDRHRLRRRAGARRSPRTAHRRSNPSASPGCIPVRDCS